MSKKRLLIILTKSGRRYLYVTSALLILGSIFCSAIVYNLHLAKTYRTCIIIDPGHGGLYTGITDNRLFQEKHVNLKLAWKLREQLERMDISVEMTRETDTALDITGSNTDMQARIDRFNSGKYDLFVSLHVMRSTSEKDMGCLVLYSGNNEKSRVLAGYVQSRLNDHFKKTWNAYLRRKPIKSGYPLLKKANIPGILIESGFMSNPAEKRLLQDSSYQTELAKAIAKGIKDFLNKNRVSSEKINPDGHPQEETLPFKSNTDSRLVLYKYPISGLPVDSLMVYLKILLSIPVNLTFEF